MFIDPELLRQVEIAKAVRRQARATRAISRALRHSAQAYTAQSSPVPVRRIPFLLLSIAEKLIDAHAFAKAENDGTTIDVIQDALQHVGKRLVKETNADGRSARAIIGRYRQECDGGADRDRPLPE